MVSILNAYQNLHQHYYRNFNDHKRNKHYIEGDIKTISVGRSGERWKIRRKVEDQKNDGQISRA